MTQSVGPTWRPPGSMADMHQGRVVSVNLAVVRTDPFTRVKSGRSGIDKRPVAGPVRVEVDGVVGDTVCDTKHHGGPEQAVYAYAVEDLDFWTAQLQRLAADPATTRAIGVPPEVAAQRRAVTDPATTRPPRASREAASRRAVADPAATRPPRAPRAAAAWRRIGPGNLGENLTVAGVDCSHAVIGERWRVGDALLRVTGPRTPCRVFAGFLDVPDLVERFFVAGRPGAYLAVEQPAAVSAGDPVTVLDRPAHGVTTADLLAAIAGHRELLPRIAQARDDLGPRRRKWLDTALAATR